MNRKRELVDEFRFEQPFGRPKGVITTFSVDENRPRVRMRF